VENIAERKKAEEELSLFQNLIHQLNDAIFVIDPETSRFLSVNNKACENLGYSRGELLTMGVIDIEAVLPDNFLWAKHIEEVRQKGFMILEGLHRRKDGTTFPAEINAALVTAGEKEYMVSVARDITERKKMQEEIHKSHKLESVGKLAGGIAHDFKNVLTAILNNISLCKMYSDPESKTFARLKEAEKALMRANDLTFQLLSFSKGGAPVKRATSLAEVVQETADFALRGSTVKCTFNIADDLLPVEADAGQISQVIHNLVINAAHAMSNGGTVWINAENTIVHSDTTVPLKEGNYVKILVRDQGPGIAEENLKKIFDPYFTTRETGQGLGLSIVYSIIKNHDGYITVESTVGSGTTFTIYLASSVKNINRDVILESHTVSGEGHILVMDDDDMIRNSLGEILRFLGYEPSFASKGEEAIELYQKAKESSHPFDAVILDLTVPGGMGGKETIQQLIKIDPEVKAIVSSGYSKDPVMAQFKEFGFCDVAEKPYKGPELSRILHKVLNSVNR
jgi:PAS domain S-box-containing protein